MRRRGEGLLPTPEDGPGELDGEPICNQSLPAAEALQAKEYDVALGICLRAIEAQEREASLYGEPQIIDPDFYCKAAAAYKKLAQYEASQAMLMRYLKRCIAAGHEPAAHMVDMHSMALEDRIMKGELGARKLPKRARRTSARSAAGPDQS